MYVLKWDVDDTNTDTYGSQIKYYSDSSVYYQNELQPAGKKIHWWETHYHGDPDPLITSRYGSKRLPQISRNQSFFLYFNGKSTPEKSVGLRIMSFDDNGQIINQKMTLESELQFQLDDDEKEYEIALVKFNNTKLFFQEILMLPETLRKIYQVQSYLEKGIIDFIPNGSSGITNGKLVIQRTQQVVNAITLPDEYLNDFIRVILIDDSWNADRLKQIGKDFQKQFKLQKVSWDANDLKAQNLLNSIM